MSFPEDRWLENYRQEQEEAKQRAGRRLDYVLPLLRLLNVLRVEVEYDGSGDEGWVKTPAYYPTPSPGLPHGLGDYLKEVVDGLLPGGWEINEGSYGTLKLNVPAGTHELEHTVREPAEFDEDEYDEEWE